MLPALRPAAGLVLAVLAACASGRGAARRGAGGEIAFRDGSVVEGSGIDAKNDEELFALGVAAEDAGDEATAAAALGRLVDAFPSSPRRLEALQRAGRAEHALGHWEKALARFEERARASAGPEADDAALAAADCLDRLGRAREAAAALEAVLARPGLEPGRRARALTERAVLQLRAGRPEEAERSLEAALTTHDAAAGDDPLDRAARAKALFYLGEVARARLRAAPTPDVAGDPQATRAALEAQSDLLLAAQERFLSAIRAGDAGWAVAASSRIGELYEELHAGLVGAAPPASLDPRSTLEYRAAVREEVRVLLEKAVLAYQETVSLARRTGASGALVSEAEERLARLRTELSREEGESAPQRAAPGPGM